MADELPMKLVIADADLALVPLAVASKDEPGAVLLHRSGLLAALEALFESIWSRAHPLELLRRLGARRTSPSWTRTSLPIWTGKSSRFCWPG